MARKFSFLGRRANDYLLIVISKPWLFQGRCLQSTLVKNNLCHIVSIADKWEKN